MRITEHGQNARDVDDQVSCETQHDQTAIVLVDARKREDEPDEPSGHCIEKSCDALEDGRRSQSVWPMAMPGLNACAIASISACAKSAQES
jgi:hypothetical protein